MNMIMFSLAILFVVFGVCEDRNWPRRVASTWCCFYACWRRTRHCTSSQGLLVWAWRCLHSEHGDGRSAPL